MKVLIYKYKKELAPTGGSNGYCFNILKELERRGETRISFREGEQISKYKPNSLKKYISTFFSFFKKKSDYVNFNEYDFIHFHSSKDLYKNSKKLKKYNGKVLFTTHSPVPSHMEMNENIKKHHKFFGLFLGKHSFSKIDKYCFNRADYIILPCPEAEESYYKHWKQYKKIHERNSEKYIYILTGIFEVSPRINPKEYRQSLGYTDDDFIVSFVGRHNEIKGYDRLIKVGEILKDTNIKFLIGGKEFPLTAPKLSNWKEIGWTNDPYSLISCSNVFVLPNRETYFDIVLLEVLSLGKNCVISNTGGNKVLIREKCDGICKFDTEEECAKEIAKMHKNGLGYVKNSNVKNIFNQKYSINVFVDNYLSFLEKIHNK